MGSNTRLMLEQLYGRSEEVKRMRERLRALSGQLYGGGDIRKRVGERIRRAGWLVHSGRVEEAERVLRAAVEGGGTAQHPDLWGALGWVRKVAGRAAGARQAFQQAAQLGSRNPDTYIHWAKLECEQGDWAGAAQAAEEGLRKAVGKMGELRYWAGYARSRWARELLARFDYDGAARECHKAEEHLQVAVRESSLGAQAWVARVLNAEVGWKLEGTKKWARRLRESLEEGEQRFPEDARLRTERERLGQLYPSLFEEFSESEEEGG